MITIIKGIMSKPVLGAALLQTINVKLDVSNRSIPNWNDWIQGPDGSTPSPSPNFLNTTGGATGFNIVEYGGYAMWSNEIYGETIGDPDFPDAVLNSMVYLNPESSKGLRLYGLSSTKRYDFIFCGFQNYTEAAERTIITVNGVSKENGVIDANVVYKQTYTVSNPTSGQIDILIAGYDYQRYATVNGFILKEYSI